MTAVARFDAEVVREVARGRWRDTIYPALGVEVGHGKHGPCPHCGGKDRFRCDDRDGSGSHFCNQCGSGDGFALVMKMRGSDFPEALRLVAGVLQLDSSTPPYSRPTPKPVRPDRRDLAFQFDVAALDRRLRAERILGAGRKLDAATMTNVELDRALGFVAQAHADLEQAGLFEHVADTLRERDFSERTNRERQTRAA